MNPTDCAILYFIEELGINNTKYFKLSLLISIFILVVNNGMSHPVSYLLSMQHYLLYMTLLSVTGKKLCNFLSKGIILPKVFYL